MASTNPARGMRDFLPVDVRKRNYVIGIIKEVYESYGFEPLETPAVENIETLLGKYGEEGNQLVFKILKRGAKLAEVIEFAELQSKEDSSNSETPQHRNSENPLADLALRYDLTVPLARVVANNKNDLPKFFKRYQIQPVWRADRPARGRFREFYQCDVDAIGSESMVVEAELISAVSEILTKLGFKDFVIRINHRELLTSILAKCGVPEDKHVDALIALDKIDKIGRDRVSIELGERGIEHVKGQKLLALVDFIKTGDIGDAFDVSSKLEILEFQNRLSKFGLSATRIKDFVQKSVQNRSREWVDFVSSALIDIQPSTKNWAILDWLTDQLDEIASSKLPIKALWELLDFVIEHSLPIQIDPTLARGLSYYTGTIMEINVPDLAGSLGGGGRYDGLIGMFGKEQIPACGFSLGLERILVVMEERGMFPPEIADSTPADVMVTIWNDDTVVDSLKLASELREQGLRVTLYPESDKLGKQFKYADSIKVPFVCVLGETEIAEGKVTVKNLTSGEQRSVERDSVATVIKEGENSRQR